MLLKSLGCKNLIPFFLRLLLGYNTVGFLLQLSEMAIGVQEG